MINNIVMRTVVQEEMAMAEVCRLLVQAGFKYTLLIMKYDNSNSVRPTGFTCNYDDDLTFDDLEKISKAFGTRNINLGCDCGTGSDRCHYREMTVKDIQLGGG